MSVPGLKLERTPHPAETYDRPAELSAAQQQALDSLMQTGLAVATFADLIGDEALWAELAADMDDFVERAKEFAPEVDRPRKKDQFLLRRWTPNKAGTVIDDPRIPSSNPWLRFASHDALLDVVNSFRGVYTRIVGIDNWYTVPYPANEERVSSQRWHRDPEDIHVVKCFLYFSDVDADAGPFEYIPGSATGGRYGRLWEWGTKKWYPPQDELEAEVPEEHRAQLTGPRGTLVLCDTAGFHRGGHARGRPRILATQTYISPDAAYASSYHQVLWEDDPAELSYQSRYALTQPG